MSLHTTSTKKATADRGHRYDCSIWNRDFRCICFALFPYVFCTTNGF